MVVLAVSVLIVAVLVLKTTKKELVMARITKPLTNTEVKQAKGKEKVYKLSDGDGLVLKVKPNGSKSWMFDYYRPHSKVRANIGFGTYPEISLADARKKRIESREQVAQGIDPKEYKDELAAKAKIAAGNTLKNVAKNWFDIKKTKIAETTSKSLWRNFENHLFPKLENKQIDKLNAPKVIEVIKPLAAKGSLETTHKMIGHLNEVMTFAVNTGLIHHNPLAGIKSAFETPKTTHLATIKPEELPALMKALSYSTIKLTSRLIIEFQLHTCVRPNECAGAAWSEIDFENKVWNIPAERMKMKKEHSVPLTPQSIAILEMMQQVSADREFVFCADNNPNKHCNSETANKALHRIGYKGKLVSHGMRSIFSTCMNQYGFDFDVIEAALAHSPKDEVRSAYNRTDYLTRRRALMEWWSLYIESAATGKEMPEVEGV